MNQKGFSVLEVVLVMLLIGIGGACASPKTQQVEEIRFRALARQVEKGIISAQYMAISTGREYNILCTEKAVYVRPGFQKAIYKFDMGRHVTIPRNITGKKISFNGSMAPSKGGTIELVNASLRKRARITVRIATGKTTIYYEKY